MKITGRARSLWPAVALLVTIGLALPLFSRSLWRDEASSVWFARLPLETLWRSLCDPHPAGYYLLLKSWLGGGESEFWLRLPSLWAACLAVALTCRLGRELCGGCCAWLAALLLACHPLQVWYAAEVRMYLPVQTAGLLLAWLGWRLIRPGRPAGFSLPAVLAYGLVGLAGLGLDYVMLLPAGLLQLLWLASGRPYPRRWLGLQLTVLLAAMWLWLNPSQRQALAQGYQPVFMAVLAARLGFDLTPAGAGWLLVVSGAVLALAALLLAWSWPGWLRRWLNSTPAGWLPVAAWVALLLLAALPRGYTVKRLLVVLLPYLALWVAYSLIRLGRTFPEVIGYRPGLLKNTAPGQVRTSGQVILFGSLAVSLSLAISLLLLPGHSREPWRAVVADLTHKAASTPGAVIWVDDLGVPAFDYYLRAEPPAGGSLAWTPLTGRRLPQLPALEPEPGQPLWLVTLDSIYRPLEGMLPPEFRRHYQLLEARRQAGISLYHYRRLAGPSAGPVAPVAPAPPTGWQLPSPLDTCGPE